jgi:hypothetical protein
MVALVTMLHRLRGCRACQRSIVSTDRHGMPGGGRSGGTTSRGRRSPRRKRAESDITTGHKYVPQKLTPETVRKAIDLEAQLWTHARIAESLGVGTRKSLNPPEAPARGRRRTARRHGFPLAGASGWYAGRHRRLGESTGSGNSCVGLMDQRSRNSATSKSASERIPQPMHSRALRAWRVRAQRVCQPLPVRAGCVKHADPLPRQ